MPVESRRIDYAGMGKIVTRTSYHGGELLNKIRLIVENTGRLNGKQYGVFWRAKGAFFMLQSIINYPIITFFYLFVDEKPAISPYSLRPGCLANDRFMGNPGGKFNL